MFKLVIKCYRDPDYEHEVGRRTTAAALDRVEDGVNVNLDHANYYTEVIEFDDPLDNALRDE